MPGNELPTDVQQLLKEQIRSIEQLEIVLLLQEDSERAWTPDEVYKVVRSSERSVLDTLNGLCKRGLLAQSSGRAGYQFAPQSDQLRETIANLARLYSERRVRIVEAIYTERTSEADEFAKAFRWRKDSDG